MFYLSEDRKVVKDSFGDIVGYLNGGKFTQVIRDGKTVKRDCDKPYLNGLSPLELEQISELLQRKK